MWKGKVLQQMMPTGELSRVWIPRKEEPPAQQEPSRDWRRRSTSVPISVTPYGRGVRDEGETDRERRRSDDILGRKGAQLLTSLLRLVSPHWVSLSSFLHFSTFVFF